MLGSHEVLTGFLLADVLRRLGMSQRKLARRIGATQDWIGRLHNGRQSPSWETVCRIARALDLSVGVFVAGDPAREQFLGTVAGMPPAAPPQSHRVAGIGPKPKPPTRPMPRKKS